MQSPELTEAVPNLLIRAKAAWRLVRDSPQTGRAHADTIVVAARAQHDWPALVAALRARGWAERDVFRYDDARRTLDEAAQIATRHRLAEQLAAVLATRASLLLETGAPARARRDIARARAALDGRSTADLDLQAAVIEDASGDLVRAVELYRGLLGRYRSLPGETAWTAHNNLGVILGQLGEVGPAERHLTRAIDLSASLGRSTRGFAVHNMAVLAARAGHLTDALRRFDEAERIFTEIDFPLVEHYMERIEVLVTLNLTREAEAVAHRAVRGLTQLDGALLLGEAQLARAKVLLARGAYSDAEQAARDAATALTRSRGRPWKANADVVLVDARVRAGTANGHDMQRLSRAAAALGDAGFLAETLSARLLGARLALAGGHTSRAVAELDQIAAMAGSRIALIRLVARLAATLSAHHRGDAPATRRAALSGLAELERLRGALPTAELRARASVHGVELASLGLGAALSTRRSADVFDWIERGRQASTLLNLRPPNDPEIAAALAELREVTSQQREAEDDLGSDPRLALRAQATLEARVLRRLRTLDAAVGAKRPPVRAHDVRALLSTAVLIELADDNGRLIAVVLDRRGGTLHELTPTDAATRELESVLFAVRRLIRARTAASQDAAHQAAVHALTELDTHLLVPLRSRLADAGEVVVVPTAALFALPWHALATLRDRQVTVVPSATAWVRAGEPPGDKVGVLVVAGPELDGAVAEAREVGSLHPGAIVLLPPDSTVAAVSERLGTVALAHLACHGDFRADNPAFSSLLLSDGPLTVTELDQLGTAPDTVVLAACDVGGSHALAGEELLGFAHVLFALGSASIVASAVPVSDVDSAPLMRALHRHIAGGMGSADALRRARIETGDATPQSYATALAFGHFGV